MPDDAPTRRSQAERTAETVALIVDAALDAIAEVGLRNATTGEISRRAGVSIGALFHHFGTRLDLIVAAVEHTLAQRMVRIASFIDPATLAAHGSDPRALLGLLRAITREPRSIVWLEVLMAARTDPELRARVAPILASQREMAHATAALHPGVRSMTTAGQVVWVDVLRDIVYGDAIWESALPHHELDELKIEVLLALAVDMGAGRPARPS